MDSEKPEIAGFMIGVAVGFVGGATFTWLLLTVQALRQLLW